MSTLFIQQGLIQICNSFLSVISHFFEAPGHDATFTWSVSEMEAIGIYVSGCLHALSRLSIHGQNINPFLVF